MVAFRPVAEHIPPAGVMTIRRLLELLEGISKRKAGIRRNFSELCGHRGVRAEAKQSCLRAYVVCNSCCHLQDMTRLSPLVER